MRGLRKPALALACALLSTCLMAAAPPPTAPTPAARDKALLAFQSDLVSVLAPSADSMPLLSAALMARSLPHQTKLNGFHSLISRAAQATDAGPVVTWARLSDCDEKASACPNSNALATLVQQAPENAAVWLLKLGIDANGLKKQDARQDLAQAAAAKIYDDYNGMAMKALASTVGVLPPPADTLDPHSAAGANGVQTIIVFGNAAALPQPNLRATAELCENAGDDASIKADCLKLGQILEWGSSPLARSLGLHLREVMSTDAAQQEEAKRARRTLVWQVQNFAELAERAQNEKPLAQHLLALARTGGTQMSLMLAALRDDGIPIEPPSDWQPQSAK
jgi:hypothetical protein